MKRLAVLFAVGLFVVVSVPSAANAHTALVSSSPVTQTDPSTPATPSPVDGSPTGESTSEDSNQTQDALIILGFSVIAMGGLILLIRAGMKAAGNDDND